MSRGRVFGENNCLRLLQNFILLTMPVNTDKYSIMRFIESKNQNLIESFELEGLVKIANEQRLATAIAKIDKLNEPQDILIRQIEREEEILKKKRKLNLLKNAKKFL